MRILISILFIPQVIILLYSKDILISIGQPIESAEIVEIMIHYQILGIWCIIQFEWIRKFLIWQWRYNILNYVQSISWFVHLIFLIFTIEIFELGIIGVSISVSMTHLFNLSLISIYLTVKKDYLKSGSWHFINRDSFKELIHIWKLAIPAMLMKWIETLNFEAMTIFSGWVGIVEQATSATIMLVVYVFMFRVPMGMAAVASNMIGNTIGAKSHQLTRKLIKITLLLSLIVNWILILWLTIFRYQLFSIFSNNEEVVVLASAIILISPLTMLGDFMQGMEIGIVLAMGHQKKASISNIIIYGCLSIPFSYILAFPCGLGIYGVWLGILPGNVLVALSFLYYIVHLLQLKKNILN